MFLVNHYPLKIIINWNQLLMITFSCSTKVLEECVHFCIGVCMQWNSSGASRVRRSSSASGRSTSTHLWLDDQGRTRQGRPTQSSWILRNPFHHAVIISQQTEPVHPAIQKFFTFHSNSDFPNFFILEALKICFCIHFSILRFNC